MNPPPPFLVDQQAVACCVLWASGCFSTFEIARLLHVSEDRVDRTLFVARSGARKREAR